MEVAVDAADDSAASLEAELSSALASQAEVATAPALQDGVESTTSVDSLQTPAAPSWREQLGFKDLDDAAAIEQVNRLRQAAQYGSQAYQQAQFLDQQNRQLQAQLQAFQQTQQVAPQAPAKPEPPKVPWQPVPIDDTYLDYIDQETGKFRNDTPIQVVANYRKQQQAIRDFHNKLYTNPHELLAPLIEQRAKEFVTPLEQKLAAMEQQYAEQQRQAEISAMLAPHRNQFYAVDQAGQVQLDQFGRPVLTEVGHNFNKYTEIAHQMGFTDPRLAAAMGALAAERDMLKAQLAQQPATTAAPAQAPRQQHDANIYKPNGKSTNGVNRIANRGNTVSVAAGDPKALQSERVSLESAAAAKLRELGFN